MQKRSIKLALAICIALALFSANQEVLADNQVVADVVNTINDKDVAIVRTIAIIDPRTGKTTVISQPTNTVITDKGESITTWPEYFVPEIKGYRPSQRTVPTKKVTSQTKPVKVIITYRPDAPNDSQGIGRDTFVDTESKKQSQQAIPKGASQAAPVSTNTDEAVDPLLGQKLKQLQAPLDHLEDDHNLSKQYELPQTGNRADTTTTLVGLAITVLTAITSLLLINKKFNKF